MGERMPIRWIQFEQQLQTLTSQGFNYASYDQVNLFSMCCFLIPKLTAKKDRTRQIPRLILIIAGCLCHIVQFVIWGYIRISWNL